MHVLPRPEQFRAAERPADRHTDAVDDAQALGLLGGVLLADTLDIAAATHVGRGAVDAGALAATAVSQDCDGDDQ